ncbi:MAG TPA: hypothetical protein VFD82_09620 [Planctomycetota bacterium]|nr:hypothetical protein [Planctomycetota bacterium]
MTESPVGQPREPEIEFLGRLASRALTLLRLVLFVAGIVAITAACYLTASPPAATTQHEGIPALQQRIANNFVWVCAGLPLLLRSRWLFGAGWWKALALGLVLWFGPMLLDGDHAYGFLIRMFASFVACVTLLVLRTLRTLTAGPTARA